MQEITHSYHTSEAPSPEIWSLCQRAGAEVMDAVPARGHAEERDVVLATPELLDVPLDPPQRLDDVHQAVVSRAAVAGLFRQQRVRQEPEPAQAVVDGDEGYPVTGQGGPVVERVLPGTELVCAWMQPDHDGPAGRPRNGTGPDVEVQAVLAETRLVAVVQRVPRNRGLAAGRPVGDRVAC